jgi:hypothetical protein
MNKKKMLIVTICVIIFVIIGSFIWWNSSSSIISITPSDVSRIDFFDGNSGKSIKITDATDIVHIITNLNEVSLEKEKISLGYSGYSFRTTMYKSNGNEYKEFIINSNHVIRKDPFFYRDISGSIDYGYIQNLFNDDSD